MKNEQDSKLHSYSQSLRKNMTPEERHLWYDFLKTLPVTVHRQKVIGPYIVDFYIASCRLVIELDGIQHKTPEHELSDRVRDVYLQNLGIIVLRYPNRSINTCFGEVCKDILVHISSPHPSPVVTPSPEGEGSKYGCTL